MQPGQTPQVAHRVTTNVWWLNRLQSYAKSIRSERNPESAQAIRDLAQSYGLLGELNRAILIYDIQVRLSLDFLGDLIILPHRYLPP